jgi:hypothetical protein
MIGGAAGAFLLASVDASSVKPIVSAYLVAVGIYIMFKAFRPLWPREVRDCGEPGLDHAFPENSKGMHWRTCDRLYERFCDYVRETHQLASPSLVRVINPLSR